MKLNLLSFGKKKIEKTILEYREDIILKNGREQIKKLAEKGLRMPVFLL